MAILERSTSAQIEKGLIDMGVMRSDHFWQLGSIASLATETTGGEILVYSILAQTWPQKRSQSAYNLNKKFLGEHAPQTPPPPPYLIQI